MDEEVLEGECREEDLSAGVGEGSAAAVLTDRCMLEPVAVSLEEGAAEVEWQEGRRQTWNRPETEKKIFPRTSHEVPCHACKKPTAIFLYPCPQLLASHHVAYESLPWSLKPPKALSYGD